MGSEMCIRDSLQMAVKLATEKQADIVIGTDPDADRFALVVKDKKSNWYYLNGNQTMVVLTEFLLQKRSTQKKAYEEKNLHLKNSFHTLIKLGRPS